MCLTTNASILSSNKEIIILSTGLPRLLDQRMCYRRYLRSALRPELITLSQMAKQNDLWKPSKELFNDRVYTHIYNSDIKWQAAIIPKYPSLVIKECDQFDVPKHELPIMDELEKDIENYEVCNLFCIYTFYLIIEFQNTLS
uniref:Uncharacterized protein n=1 Tax=Heterorhabditis bacteriophora TaxID=37862 RepID=A0A1I7WWN4_HETBA